MAVWCRSPERQAEAAALAARLGVECLSGLSPFDPAPEPHIVLVVDEDRLGLADLSEKKLSVYTVDFQTGPWELRARQGLSKNQILAKALGLRRNHPLRVLDATAGFCQDAYFFYLMGAQVIALERSPAVFEVASDGLRRASVPTAPSAEQTGSIQLIHQDAEAYLSESKTRFDVIYLDPMFQKPKQTAKSPKSMELLKTLLKESPKIKDDLLEQALQHTPRVVTKSPLKGKVFHREPTHSFKGKSIRYDIYLP